MPKMLIVFLHFVIFLAANELIKVSKHVIRKEGKTEFEEKRKENIKKRKENI